MLLWISYNHDVYNIQLTAGFAYHGRIHSYDYVVVDAVKDPITGLSLNGMWWTREWLLNASDVTRTAVLLGQKRFSAQLSQRMHLASACETG